MLSSGAKPGWRSDRGLTVFHLAAKRDQARKLGENIFFTYHDCEFYTKK